MSKVRWKDTLPEVDEPSLELAAVWLGRALLSHRGGNVKGALCLAGRAAAHIRGVRKGLGVSSERRGVGANLTGANLLWAASGEVAIAAQWLPDEPQHAVWNLRYAEACIRTYMTEVSS